MNIHESDSHAENRSRALSSNFAFLASKQPFLVRLAAAAERYVFDDPTAALVKLRLFAELMAKRVLAEAGVEFTPLDKFEEILFRLRDQRVASPEVLELFHGIRKAGNPRDVRHWPYIGSVVYYLGERVDPKPPVVPRNFGLPFPLGSRRRLKPGPYGGFLGSAYDTVWSEFQAKGTR
ncbi:MAG TPA: hypothetical protein VGL71_08270, partial [Urbifossiella sp.]